MSPFPSVRTYFHGSTVGEGGLKAGEVIAHELVEY
jgi:hypothetical protein